MSEIWKTHPIFGGKYEVSSVGNIRHIENKKNLTLSTNLGYVYPTLSSDKGMPVRKRLHRMIAECFISNPENKPCVNHKNGIKNDNRIENLEWMTVSENTKHGYRVLGIKPNKSGLGKTGELSCRSKKINQYDLCGNFLEMFYGIQEAGRKLNISPSGINNVLKMKQVSIKGFIFKYT